MNHHSYKTHRAFTLVELLMVVIIITMLAALTLTAASFAVKASKETKTRVTIQKLDTAMRRIYEGYADKFDNISGYLEPSKRTEAAALAVDQQAEVKLHLIHDLMRLELPDRAADMTTVPQSATVDGHDYALQTLPVVTALYQTVCAGKNVTSAELLFLII